METVIVTGTRRIGVTVPESSTPIDVVSGEKLQQQGFSDLNDSLRTLIPSLNVQRFNAESYSVVVRPFTLRGLAPDETLVLVNGKRRHRSSIVQLSRLPLASGSHGPDLSTIPTLAIDRVEVLRDGAAAQYGSDAIAGVVNFRLKGNNKGGVIETRYGEYSKGDGQEFTLAGNVGLPLADKGFVSITGEFTRAHPTDRSLQRADAAALVAAGNTNIKDPVQPHGNPNAEGHRLFLNSELPLGEVTVYAFGNHADSHVEAGQFYREPRPNGARADIFASVPLTNTPGGPRFSFASRFPGGLVPFHRYKVRDSSLTGGVKGILPGALDYDLSFSGAESRAHYGIYDTVNPSLGPTAPTEYNSGAQSQVEKQFHADFVYEWNTGVLAKPLNVAFGTEYRNEAFKLNAGEPNSYIAGPFARVRDPDTGGFIGLAVGASAFPGIQPSQAGRWSRHNWAGYLDLETEVVQRLTLGAAARYEKFSDFGSTFNYKFSGRYELSKALALRSSFNTGFRAPTVGQQHISAVSNTIDQNTGNLVVLATLPVSNPIAQYFGARELKPEKSKNLSVGGVVTLPDEFLLTIDYFNIRTIDRIGVTSQIPISAADAAALAARGITLNGTQRVAFFANAFSTKTRGIDLVVSKRLKVAASDVDLSAGVNYTKTTPYNITDPRAVDRERQIELTTFNPKWRANLAGTVTQGPLSFLTRVSYYGKWVDAVATPSATAFDQEHAAKAIFDIEGTYEIGRAVKFSIGVQNLFDTYPEKERLPANIAAGQLYPFYTPWGNNGRFLYARLRAQF